VASPVFTAPAPLSQWPQKSAVALDDKPAENRNRNERDPLGYTKTFDANFTDCHELKTIGEHSRQSLRFSYRVVGVFAGSTSVNQCRHEFQRLKA
jgi:hypothetical protein